MQRFFDYSLRGDIYNYKVVTNDNEKLVIKYNLPGYNKSNLKMSIEDGLLSVESKEDDPSVNIDLRLNTNIIDSKIISAECKDGVLYITLPKRKKKRKFIAIE